MCTLNPLNVPLFHLSTPSGPEGNLFVWQWDPKKVKGGWVPDEDELLASLVTTLGPNWKTIATYFPTRTGKQCRERYINCLDPNITTAPWSEEEDQVIIEYHKKWGNKWSEVAKTLSGRTANAIKNRWHSNLKRRLERMESPKVKKTKMESSNVKPLGVYVAPIKVEEPFLFEPPMNLDSDNAFSDGFSSDSEPSSSDEDSSFDDLFDPLKGFSSFYSSDIQDILEFGNVDSLSS